MKDDNATRILLVEDDNKLATLIKTYLSKYDFKIFCAADGKLGLEEAKEHLPHLIVLDMMLPKMDGLSVCRELRTWYKGRIIFLTASDEDMDQVASLEIGADDFVTKPIHPRVLLARIRMLLRREEAQLDYVSNEEGKSNTNLITFGSLNLNLGRRQVLLDNKEVVLTEAEFNLLWLLASHPEEPLSRDNIMKSIRGVEHDGLDRSIDNRIVTLRRKLNDNQGLPKRIITLRGKGYLFVTDQW